MSYLFQQDESLADGVRRIAGHQVHKAIEELQNSESDRHEAIHEVRKRFKKLRGLIRIVRPGLGNQYSQINVWYRDAGRRLSRVRDAESMLESLAKLKVRFDDPAYAELFAAFEKCFQARKQQLVEEWIDLEQELQTLCEELQTAQKQIENWKIKGNPDKILREGLQQNYRRGAEALTTLHEQPSDELFHECRKRSKYYLYHMRLLKDVWEPILSAQLSVLDPLNDYLGDDHDLAVMTCQLTSEPERFGAASDIDQFLTLIARQREELQSAALSLADRIYAEKPKAFAKRLQTYWKLWQDTNAQKS
ncbi:CHAD domain protein [Gimesia panareensis]|uniref:CHAD domain protein n=1 Tax=Gimesia panareensis TaxID=2527978 RepID=A0A518FPM7_9PLAN|nr:CHAD domain-containing protein [Gimesia panareensis]QDV18301.1 CHAD domain protein [Gimesia panareensis]